MQSVHQTNQSTTSGTCYSREGRDRGQCDTGLETSAAFDLELRSRQHPRDASLKANVLFSEFHEHWHMETIDLAVFETVSWSKTQQFSLKYIYRTLSTHVRYHPLSHVALGQSCESTEPFRYSQTPCLCPLVCKLGRTSYGNDIIIEKRGHYHVTVARTV